MRKLPAKLWVVGILGSLALGLGPGCGRKSSSPPPLTEDVKAQIEKEDQAVFEAESAQARNAGMAR